MKPKRIVATKRLLLREFTLSDASFILKLVNTPSWLTFIGDRNVHTIPEAEQFLNNSLLKSYGDNGYGLWMVELIENNIPIGMCGLVNRESLEDIDIGFALLPEHEKKGFAFEAAEATINYAENTLKIDRIVGITNADNTSSIALLNKLGLYFEKELQLSEYDNVQLYSPLNTVHILNGDSLKEQFPSEIKGEKIIARECMVDGSVKGDSIEEIFETRADFICETFGETRNDYYDKVVSEFNKINNISTHSEINLWFEDDLFCQINFWFVLYYMLENDISVPLYLIRPTTPYQYGFGGMNKQELQGAYNNRMHINHVNDIGALWNMYQNENISEMIQLSESLKTDYPFLLPAVIALKESIENNKPKNSIKAIIKDLNTTSFGPVFSEFCKREAIYGFGDVQVKRLFDEVIYELEN